MRLPDISDISLRVASGWVSERPSVRPLCMLRWDWQYNARIKNKFADRRMTEHITRETHTKVYETLQLVCRRVRGRVMKGII